MLTAKEIADLIDAHAPCQDRNFVESVIGWSEIEVLAKGYRVQHRALEGIEIRLRDALAALEKSDAK